MKYLLFALRPKHWVKNFFVFLPLIFGGKLFAYPENLKTAIAFILFCMASSAAYLINDIIDIDKDKIHPIKCIRPVASGKVSLKQAAITAFILGILSIMLSFAVSAYFGYVLVIYLVFNFLYSKILKEVVIIDVFCISVFFLLRIISGGIITGMQLSRWIVIMSTLLTLFLGFNKRRQELKLFGRKAHNHRRVLAKYSVYFIDYMIKVITFLILITYMLYTVDARTVMISGTKNLTYTIPFVYCGIFRYLYLINKVKSDGDPVYILFSDRMMQLTVVLWVVVSIGVIYFRF